MADPRKLEEGFGTENAGKKDGENTNRDNSIENEPKSTATSDLIPEEQREEQPLIKQKTKRVATLDAFRGLTIVVMIFFIAF